MIKTVNIENFRCYRTITLQDCARLNVILGENGSGKTALLEAIFLPLAIGPEVAFRLRSQRGLDSQFGGSPRRVEEGLWGDFFNDYDMDHPIRLSLLGNGPEKRSLEISRGVMEAEIPLGAPVPITLNETVPVTFKWTDHSGGQHAIIPRIHDGKLILPETGEASSPFFHFPAAHMVGSGETAERFSQLSKANKHRKFVKIFTREYPWIKDLNVEVNAGAPALYATLRGNDRRVPVANVSGGINRMLAIMLAISTEKHSIVLVDEVENGIYFSNLPSVWRSILALLREYDSQMFVTTHSMECLEALVTASGDNMSDIALWRTDRQDSEIKVSRLRGDVLRAAVAYGEEIR